MWHQVTELKNGVKVISERIEHVRSISLGIWFKVGSRDESDDVCGISHFLEHMMFKGTPTRDALKISQEFESIGAEQNAFTSKENTCYYARFVDDKLPKVIEIMSDMVTNSLFDVDSITSEREVVIEEIARSEDTPEDFVFELFGRKMFPTHTLGRQIIGTREVVGAFSQQDCLDFFKQNYHAKNCVVVASGNVDHRQLVELCEQYLSDLPDGTINDRDTVAEYGAGGLVSLTKETEQAHILYGMPGLSMGDEDRFAGAMLDTVLGGGMSSRLFQEIREKRGLAYAIYASNMQYLGAGQFVVYAGTRPANITEVIGIVQTEIKNLLENGIFAEELDRIREYVIGLNVLALEYTTSRMMRLGKSAISGLEILSLDELIGHYRRVTLEDVARIAQKVYSQKPTIAVISPLKDKELKQALANVV